MSAAITPEVETEEETKLNKNANVVLLNDDIHSFQYVVEMLIKVCKHGVKRARELTYKVDKHGRAIIWSGETEKAHEICKACKGYGTDFYMRPNTTVPMNVHVEEVE